MWAEFLSARNLRKEIEMVLRHDGAPALAFAELAKSPRRVTLYWCVIWLSI
jgi:hypothetical protein